MPGTDRRYLLRSGTQCPVLTDGMVFHTALNPEMEWVQVSPAIGLRVSYALPGTDMLYGGTSPFGCPALTSHGMVLTSHVIATSG
eukprot:2958803-Rhodomonas_salina.6